MNAARKPILGADRVGRSLLAFARKGRGSSQVRFVDVNGMPGLLIAEASGILTVTAFTIDGGRIVALDVVRNPEKLRHVQGVR